MSLTLSEGRVEQRDVPKEKKEKVFQVCRKDFQRLNTSMDNLKKVDFDCDKHQP